MAFPKKSAPPPPLRTYGMYKPGNPNQFDYDVIAFNKRLGVERGCPTRFEMFKKIADTIVPGHFEWHSWTERALRPLLPDDPTKKVILAGFPGCSNSAKTFNITSFATIWWLCWPEESSVTLVSTTRNMMRRRAWAEVQRIFAATPYPKFGNFVDSRTIWQVTKGDDKHAIIGQAVEEGSTQKIVDNLKGIHTKRQMIVIDEATSIPRAIFEACSNLYSYPDEFIVAVIGNPWSRLDQFGLFCEPKDGWNSVNVDTGEWDAVPFEFAGGSCPRVVTFDAEKCPNITEGKVVSRHLPKKEDVESAKRNSGGGITPKYWQDKRGFWPPEGMIKTVFTESALIKFDAYGKHKFLNNNFTVIGALDQAFGGGDKPCLRFGLMGTLERGGIGIQALPPIILNIRADDKQNPARYQLAKLLRQHCEKVEVAEGVYMECRPECVCVDDTGDGGLADICYRTWSNAIIRVEFNGSASEDQVSLEDIRPAKEVYHNKRVEMYHFTRNATNSEQLKGIDRETAKELCAIEYSEEPSKKIKLQSKKEYRETHGGESPDLADSLVMLCEVGRHRGFKLFAQGVTAKVIEEEAQEVKESQEIYHENNLWQEEEIEDGVESLQ